MDTPNEKDYIDAKLQAFIERLNGEAKAHQLATDARLDKLNQTIDAGLKSVREESSTKYAQLEASFRRGQSEVIKWVSAQSSPAPQCQSPPLPCYWSIQHRSRPQPPLLPS